MKLPRMYDFYVVTVLLIGIIWALAPQQLPVTLYKVSLITLSGLIGYWLDRSLFPYARPDTFKANRELDSIKHCDNCPMGFAASMLRRAIIVGSTIIGISLGV